MRLALPSGEEVTRLLKMGVPSIRKCCADDCFSKLLEGSRCIQDQRRQLAARSRQVASLEKQPSPDESAPVVTGRAPQARPVEIPGRDWHLGNRTKPREQVLERLPHQSGGLRSESGGHVLQTSSRGPEDAIIPVVHRKLVPT